MKIEFTFDNITQLEELYYAVENIPSEILEDEKELGTPVKEDQQLYHVIMKLKSKLEKLRTQNELLREGGMYWYEIAKGVFTGK